MKNVLVYIDDYIDIVDQVTAYLKKDMVIKYVVVFDEQYLIKMKSSEEFTQYIFLSGEEAKGVKYDYCLNLSEKRLPGEIFSINQYKEFFWEYSDERYTLYMQYIDCNKSKMMGLILGMSYIQRGTNLERFTYSTCSLAAPAQDLFCDWGMCRWAIEKTGLANLKYCIIEVNPYRLWYDLSLSVNKKRMLYYIPQLGELHHFTPTVYIKNYNHMKETYEQVFEFDIIRDIFEGLGYGKVILEKDINIFSIKSKAEQKKNEGEIAKLFNKPYEETYSENVEILNNMVLYLIEKSIIPVIVIPPFPSIFIENMDNTMYGRTKDVLYLLKEKVPQVRILDYIGNSLFDDYYFSDWSHLNYWGSNLLTDLINEELRRIISDQ